jgi:hypothetical protein
MPTYLNNIGRPMMRHDTSCRQIYEHVKDCPVCQQLFMSAMYHQDKQPRFIIDSYGPSSSPFEISPTSFLIVIAVIGLLVYFLRH